MTSITLTATEVPHFSDREDAGRQLGARLNRFRTQNVVVVGIATDGLPVAAEVADALGAPLQAVGVEPLMFGGPHRRRFGTAAEGGVALFERAFAQQVDARSTAVDAAIASAQRRLSERADSWYRGGRRPSLRRRHILLVDDVLEDDESAAAAACAVLDRGAADVTYAAPLVRLDAASSLIDWVDEVVSLSALEANQPASTCFTSFEPVSDEQARNILVSHRSLKGHSR